jgi:hypothetical protein
LPASGAARAPDWPFEPTGKQERIALIVKPTNGRNNAIPDRRELN